MAKTAKQKAASRANLAKARKARKRNGGKSFGAFAVTGKAHTSRSTIRLKDTSKNTVRGVDTTQITTVHTVRSKNKLAGVKVADIPGHKRTKRTGNVRRRVY